MYVHKGTRECDSVRLSKAGRYQSEDHIKNWAGVQ